MDRKTYNWAKRTGREAYEQAIRDAGSGGGQPTDHEHPHEHDEFADFDDRLTALETGNFDNAYTLGDVGNEGEYSEGVSTFAGWAKNGNIYEHIQANSEEEAILKFKRLHPFPGEQYGGNTEEELCGPLGLTFTRWVAEVFYFSSGMKTYNVDYAAYGEADYAFNKVDANGKDFVGPRDPWFVSCDDDDIVSLEGATAVEQTDCFVVNLSEGDEFYGNVKLGFPNPIPEHTHDDAYDDTALWEDQKRQDDYAEEMTEAIVNNQVNIGQLIAALPTKADNPHTHDEYLTSLPSHTHNYASSSHSHSNYAKKSVEVKHGYDCIIDYDHQHYGQSKYFAKYRSRSNGQLYNATSTSYLRELGQVKFVGNTSGFIGKLGRTGLLIGSTSATSYNTPYIVLNIWKTEDYVQYGQTNIIFTGTLSWLRESVQDATFSAAPRLYWTWEGEAK